MPDPTRLIILAFLAVLASGCRADGSPGDVDAPRTPARPTARAGSPQERVSSGRLYVPVYSHIYVSAGEASDLAATVSVRNVSTERSLVLESVRYYDTAGKVLESFIREEAVLRPLETVEFFVATADRRGGSGANVIVEWHADSPVAKPLVEAVMVHSTANNRAYAFSTRAIEIPAAEAPSKPSGP